MLVAHCLRCLWLNLLAPRRRAALWPGACPSMSTTDSGVEGVAKRHRAQSGLPDACTLSGLSRVKWWVGYRGAGQVELLCQAMKGAISGALHYSIDPLSECIHTLCRVRLLLWQFCSDKKKQQALSQVVNVCGWMSSAFMSQWLSKLSTYFSESILCSYQNPQPNYWRPMCEFFL